MGERLTRRVIVVGVVALGAGALLAVGVAAHTARHDSSLNLNAFTSGAMNNYFYGAVTSSSSKCVAGRRVRVYRKRPGENSEFGSHVSLEAGSGVGPYTVTAPEEGDIPVGSYYSQVRKRHLRRGARHDHICRGARSADLEVGP
jgi:hypothetical protein